METDDSDNGLGTAGTSRRERMDYMKGRAREARDTAMHRVSETPGWVWAVIGGVALLVVGILAASRYRSRRRDWYEGDHG